MESIQKISSFVPASFEQREDKLSPAQVALLNLIRESVDKKSPITSEIILDLYIKNVKKSETYQQHKWNWKDGVYGPYGEMEIKHRRSDYMIKSQAKQWFKNNLSSWQGNE